MSLTADTRRSTGAYLGRVEHLDPSPGDPPAFRAGACRPLWPEEPVLAPAWGW